MESQKQETALWMAMPIFCSQLLVLLKQGYSDCDAKFVLDTMQLHTSTSNASSECNVSQSWSLTDS